MTILMISPCYGQATNGQRGAIAGGTAGAVIGGIIGHQNDETTGGALIGGTLGVLAGGLLGKQQDQFEQERFQYQQQQAHQQAIQYANGVSINDVIALTRSGVDYTVIINQIQSSGVQQRIGVDEIIALHQNGVNNQVINVMQEAHLAGVERVAPPVEVVPVVPAYSSGTVYELPGPRPIVVPRPVVIKPGPIVIKRSVPVPSRPRPHYGHGHYRQASPRTNPRYRR